MNEQDNGFGEYCWMVICLISSVFIFQSFLEIGSSVRLYQDGVTQIVQEIK